MIRWGIIIIIIGAAAVVAGWLARVPGDVTLQWHNYAIDTSVAFIILAILILIALVILVARLWISLRRAPWTLSENRRRHRERRGYEALSRGMVAVAAGDAEAAVHQSKRAESLLKDRPLTMLLSAQAAQLQGDDQAASRFFTAMRERPETEFLGVRGLLVQAMKQENWDEALTLARRAYRLNPDSDWVTTTLFQLEKRLGNWQDAESTLENAANRRLVPRDHAARERAEILYNRSLDATGDEALRLAKQAVKVNPAFLPAVTHLARLYIAHNQHRRAQSLLQQTWESTPAPDLAAIYLEARECTSEAQKLAATEQLAARNPDHAESRMAVAAAALDAKDWNRARTALEPLATDQAEPRVCHFMARLEEGQNGDLVRAKMWLERAAGVTTVSLPTTAEGTVVAAEEEEGPVVDATADAR